MGEGERMRKEQPNILSFETPAKGYEFYMHKYFEKLAKMDSSEHIIILCNLLVKRHFDGLNGRPWDASIHLIAEEYIQIRLKEPNDE
jgi:hypothetical protein